MTIKTLATNVFLRIKIGDAWKMWWLKSPNCGHKFYGDWNGFSFFRLYLCPKQPNMSFDLGGPKLTLFWHDIGLCLCPNGQVISW
jgi:hypothetical protein